jgi:hypothetical protein
VVAAVVVAAAVVVSCEEADGSSSLLPHAAKAGNTSRAASNIANSLFFMVFSPYCKII